MLVLVSSFTVVPHTYHYYGTHSAGKSDEVKVFIDVILWKTKYSKYKGRRCIAKSLVKHKHGYDYQQSLFIHLFYQQKAFWTAGLSSINGHLPRQYCTIISSQLLSSLCRLKRNWTIVRRLLTY